MKKETYIKMTKPFRDNAKWGRSLHIINKICTAIIFACYPCWLIYLFVNRMPDELFRAIVVPMDSFIFLSVFRYMVNRPRPYEAFEMPSIIEKKTKGKSFPSRHVFSAVIIAMTLLCQAPWIWVGVILLIIALGLAITRVLSGVHYISDVIAGAAFGVIAALVGFFVI